MFLYIITVSLSTSFICYCHLIFETLQVLSVMSEVSHHRQKKFPDHPWHLIIMSSLVSFNLEEFLIFLGLYKASTLLKMMCQLFCRVTLSLALFDILWWLDSNSAFLAEAFPDFIRAPCWRLWPYSMSSHFQGAFSCFLALAVPGSCSPCLVPALESLIFPSIAGFLSGEPSLPTRTEFC